MRNLTGTVSSISSTFSSVGSAAGVFRKEPVSGQKDVVTLTPGNSDGFSFDASRQVNVGADFAPRSVAFNYIVRAL